MDRSAGRACDQPVDSGHSQATGAAACPNGDFVAVGHNVSGSSGNPIAIALVRFGSDGTLQWRVDLDSDPSERRPIARRFRTATPYLAFQLLG